MERVVILAIVKGEVVSTVKHPAYENRRLLLVDRIDGDEHFLLRCCVEDVDRQLAGIVVVKHFGVVFSLP